MSVTDHLGLYPQDEKRRKAAIASFTEEDRIKWLMGSEIGRAIVWSLFEDAKVLTGPLFNSTATTLAVEVAERDFVVRHLLKPILAHCPSWFLQMKKEHDERHAGDAAKPN